MGRGPVLGPSRGVEQKHQPGREMRRRRLMPALRHVHTDTRGPWWKKELIPQPKGELLDHRGAVPTVTEIVADPDLVPEDDVGRKQDLTSYSSMWVRLACILPAHA